ncbi:non-specific lipid transfer protein GPI-anchored 2-like [Cynara cardunculus var. scolymus]|uniref:non-specific lipid transfer protein GPI-anchored 2-like n=1 Tax=Cynara cardunculus var. scolymus TaxID=59895 RepID=UPI000D624C62|nr:non-specific lipid transfer protein GPI-anchored 2-like [Cynara cardunculus var. scolymus]
MGLILILVVMPWVETTAQPGCMIAFIGLAPCLSSVSGNSSTPSSACCSQLSNIVQVQPQCLCSLVNGGGTANLGISINQTLALSLPRACNVQTPPVSQCNGVANGPTPSSAKSDKIPEAPTSTSQPTGGSKSVPSTGGGGDASNGVIVRTPTHVLAFALFVVSCTFIV